MAMVEAPPRPGQPLAPVTNLPPVAAGSLPTLVEKLGASHTTYNAWPFSRCPHAARTSVMTASDAADQPPQCHPSVAACDLSKPSACAEAPPAAC